MISQYVKENQDCVESYPNEWIGNYNGTVHRTVISKTCKMWSGTKFSTYGLTNYCRAPKNDSDSPNGPWCYVDGNSNWEHCFIPICSEYILCNLNTHVIFHSHINYVYIILVCVCVCVNSLFFSF